MRLCSGLLLGLPVLGAWLSSQSGEQRPLDPMLNRSWTRSESKSHFGRNQVEGNQFLEKGQLDDERWI